jgi:hypothetical protein
MSRNPESGSMVFMKLLGRLHAEGDLLPRILTTQFGDVLQRFGFALLRGGSKDLARHHKRCLVRSLSGLGLSSDVKNFTVTFALGLPVCCRASNLKSHQP